MRATTAGPVFVVAVTGHRDLHPADVEQVREQLHDLLALVAGTLPDTRIDCLSALADGADQLFAEQVLRLQDRLGARIRLLVPLPMPLDAYVAAQAGDAPAAQAAFRARLAPLLARAHDVFEAPPAPSCGDGAAPDCLPYARLAAYLARAADLVIAVWDGRTAPALRQPGGTLDVVMRRAEAGSGATLQVPVRRANASAAAAAGTPPGHGPALVTAAAPGELRCEPLAPEAIAALVLERSAAGARARQ